MWKMVKEAVDFYGGNTSHDQVHDYIHKQWDYVGEKKSDGSVDPVKKGTIYAKLRILAVNVPERVSYWENLKPRLTDSGSNYDLLFSMDNSEIMFYDINIHGVWEIYIADTGRLDIRKVK